MTFDASEYTKAFLVNMGDFQGGKLPYDRMEAAMDPLCSFSASCQSADRVLCFCTPGNTPDW